MPRVRDRYFHGKYMKYIHCMRLSWITAILILTAWGCYHPDRSSSRATKSIPPALPRIAEAPRVVSEEYEWIAFDEPPMATELRHLAEQPGTWHVGLKWNRDFGPDAFRAFQEVRLSNVSALDIGDLNADADVVIHEITRPDTGLTNLASLGLTWNRHSHGLTSAGLKALARPDSGLKMLTTLNLGGMPVTDGGVKELARANTSLKALVELNLGGTIVTDDALMELARPDSGLKALRELHILVTRVTDRGLQELARPDSGLKGLVLLDVRNTYVTGAGIAALKKALPGLRVKWEVDD
jgi:hypothetical protein